MRHFAEGSLPRARARAGTGAARDGVAALGCQPEHRELLAGERKALTSVEFQGSGLFQESVSDSSVGAGHDGVMAFNSSAGELTC